MTNLPCPDCGAMTPKPARRWSLYQARISLVYPYIHERNYSIPLTFFHTCFLSVIGQKLIKHFYQSLLVLRSSDYGAMTPKPDRRWSLYKARINPDYLDIHERNFNRYYLMCLTFVHNSFLLVVNRKTDEKFV